MLSYDEWNGWFYVDMDDPSFYSANPVNNIAGETGQQVGK